MMQRPVHLGFAVLLATVGAIGCAAQPVPSAPAAPSSAVPAPAVTAPTRASASAPAPSASPAPSTTFAFSPGAVLEFYAGAGFACQEPQASTRAEGWTVTTCERSDAAGRRLAVGIVRGPDGTMGDGFARVTARQGEDVLSPEAALDHLSGFLGAMLGEDRATPLLPWLAGSMGNAYEERTLDDLRIATYLEPEDDPRTIWLELAGPAYLAAAKS